MSAIGPLGQDKDTSSEASEVTSPSELWQATSLEDLVGKHETADGDEEGAGTEETGEEPLGFVAPPMMSLMDFVDIVLTLPSTHPVVVLQETEMPYRELRIPIGGPEGVAIGYAARQVDTPRPLTHELVVRLLEQFSLTLDMVKINGVQGQMFTAEITVSGAAGTRTLDCRPSDAIALALRHRLRVPILVAPEVLDAAGGAPGGSN